MAVLRAVARPMLAAIFAIQGYQTMTNPARVAPLAEPVVRPAAEHVPLVTGNVENAVRINGAVQVAAGLLLATGRAPRLAALAIAASLVPTTLAGHRFWEADKKEDQAAQRIQFLKNLSILGGLLITAADTNGKPSLSWRRQAARNARTRASRHARPATTGGSRAARGRTG